MYLNMFGTDVMVLNSSEAIADLLDKRSAIYSDKVVLYTTLVRLRLMQPCTPPPTASNTDIGTDRFEQVVVHGVRIRRKVEDTSSTLPRVFQCCNRGEVRRRAKEGSFEALERPKRAPSGFLPSYSASDRLPCPLDHVRYPSGLLGKPLLPCSGSNDRKSPTSPGSGSISG